MSFTDKNIILHESKKLSKETMKITGEENDKFSLENKLFEPLNPYPGKYSKEYISKYLKHEMKINRRNRN